MRIEGGDKPSGLGWSPVGALKKAGKFALKVQLAPITYQVKYGKKLLKHKETWAAGVIAAGTALGIPPSITVPLAATIMKSGGKIPPGTDPRLAAYVQQHPPPGLWERFLTWLGVI